MTQINFPLNKKTFSESFAFSFQFLVTMTSYTTEQKIYLVQEYYRRGDNGLNAYRSYCTHFRVRNGPSKSMITDLIKKFEEHGTVNSPPTLTGRPSTAITDEKIEEVRVMFQNSPTKSMRKGAQQAGISRRSLGRILTDELNMFPYKIQFHQPISPKAIESRVEFANHIVALVDGGNIDVNRVWFTDEAHFDLQGYVNKQNFRHWGSENPHITEVRPLHPQRVTAWCGISGDVIAGPYWFNQTVNAERYMSMLKDGFFPFAESKQAVSSFYYQQDGARSHWTRNVFNLLQDKFQDRIIGLDSNQFTGGGIDWPPYSPDLNPCDYFLWGYLKDRVYINKPKSLDELKENIRREIRNIPQDTLKNVTANFVMRLRHVIAVEGGHFETLVQ